jgi:C4-dicarboxylate transporter, DctM subunit
MGAGRIETLLLAVTRPLASIGVAGMLIVACVTVVNVLMRWLAGGGIVALNEVVAMIFAVAVAATLPAGVAQRINLKVDLLGHLMSERVARRLAVIGSVLLALFFVLLARELWFYAARMASSARTTPILDWPVAPFMYAVAVFAGIAALAQIVIAGLDLRAALATAEPGGRERTHGGVLLLIAVAAMSIGGLIAWASIDFSGMSRAVQSAPVPAVGLGFVVLWLVLLLLVPVAAVMGLAGIVGTAFFLGFGPSLNVFSSEATGFLTNPQVAALPLFLMMGSFASVAGLSDDVYRLAQAVLGRLRGGLALATVGGCAGFGAVTGSSLATAATFGRISLPQMRALGYAPTLSTGCVAAGGTLGALIPPSAPIILFALLTEASIGQLFIAAVIPGLLAVALYLATIMLLVRMRPDIAPAAAAREVGARRRALMAAGPVTGLFGAVIGGLYSGVFTATESAAVGAVGAFLIALWRGKLNASEFWRVMGETTAVTAMIYGLIFGALTFSFFVGVSQLPDIVTRLIGGLDVTPLIIVLLLLVAYLLLGSVMDSFAVMVITVPIVTPLILGMGYDLVWWGIVMLVVVETGLITPPFGINLFVIRSIQQDIPLSTVFRGALPFVLSDFLRLALLVLFPALILWLPATM